VNFAYLQWPDFVIMLLLSLGILLTVARLWLGPDAADRIVAADTLSVMITVLMLLLAFWFDSALYLDVALIYAVLAFVGTVALARTIERGGN